MNKTLLIDGDILFYRFAFSAETGVQWDEDAETLVTNFPKAQRGVDDFVVDLYEKTKCEEGLICFSSSSNFRYDVYPAYKGNRDKSKRPSLYQDLKDYIIETYPCKTKEGIEADDIMGIMSTRYPGKYIIASADKDMKQIPGFLYNWMDGKGLREISERQADWWFYMQILTGDAVDNYPGCPGIGAAKAGKILDDVLKRMDEGTPYAEWDGLHKEFWKAIVKTYESKGLIEHDALVQARCARILRASDYDFKKGKVKLWTP